VHEYDLIAAIAVVVVELHPPEEGLSVLEEAEVEGVLGEGLGEVEAFLERLGVVALPGELFELGIGEALFGGKGRRQRGRGRSRFFIGLGGDGGEGFVEALAEVGEAKDVGDVAGDDGAVGIVE
jgi:hypothetical protein